MFYKLPNNILHKQLNTVERNAGFLILLLCLLLPLSSAAETVYVGDTLRVGIRAEPGKRTASLTVVASGAELTVLGKEGGYTLVKAPNGVEGWVNSAYLTSNEPVQIRLRDASSKIRKLESQLERFSKMQPGQAIQIEALADTISKLEQERDQLRSQLGSSSTPIQNSAVEDLSNFAAPQSDYQFFSLDTLIWVALVTAFFLSLGFLVGVSWHKSQVTKRLGGLSL
ncbi:MAG: TIGR04211 family SH3 domain-containing protein [Gammaproteobacteria bacterium]|nr:TIGR04211 family SH3 domain-containing protein [Gammaproteobacteria bacterium]MDH5694002.1 TIGR04211 family SH3 domain-containing protein [Gammaproteobacteria bacterium]